MIYIYYLKQNPSVMNKIHFYILATIIIFVSPIVTLSQSAPDLATAAPFVLFTGAGEVTSQSPSAIVIGDVGNVTGDTLALPPGFLFGKKHWEDAVAVQASADIGAAYAQAASNACGIVHAGVYGLDETLVPGVYCTGAANTLSGNLTLDAGNNPNAIFIFKIDGALSSIGGSQIILLNGAVSCNIFWQINGLVSLVNTNFKGTILANGAITLSSGSSLDGRALSKAGAIIFGDVRVTLCNPALLPLQLINFNVTKTTDNNAQITWVTASEVDVLRYEVETSVNGIDFYKIETISSKSNTLPNEYSLQDVPVNKTGVRFYRLKMINKDGSFTYSPVKTLKFSDLKIGLINIFPNPAANNITVSVNAEAQEKVSLTIANMHGQKVLQKTYLLNKGVNNFAEDIHGLSKASYIVSIKNISTGKETRQNFQKL